MSRRILTHINFLTYELFVGFLMLYIILSLIESFKEGSVSSFLDVNLVIIAMIMFALVWVFTNENKPSATGKLPTLIPEIPDEVYQELRTRVLKNDKPAATAFDIPSVAKEPLLIVAKSEYRDELPAQMTEVMSDIKPSNIPLKPGHGLPPRKIAERARRALNNIQPNQTPLPALDGQKKDAPSSINHISNSQNAISTNNTPDANFHKRPIALNQRNIVQ